MRAESCVIIPALETETLQGSHCIKVRRFQVTIQQRVPRPANLRQILTWAQVNAPEQAIQLARWMHSDFHQTGLHVFVQHNKPINSKDSLYIRKKVVF